MFAIARFKVSEQERESFLAGLDSAHQALSRCEGYLNGKVGSSTDEPTLIALVTEWRNIGAYRRALSNFEVKMTAVPILARAIDEPGGYISAGE